MILWLSASSSCSQTQIPEIPAIPARLLAGIFARDVVLHAYPYVCCEAVCQLVVCRGGVLSDDETRSLNDYGSLRHTGLLRLK